MVNLNISSEERTKLFSNISIVSKVFGSCFFLTGYTKEKDILLKYNSINKCKHIRYKYIHICAHPSNYNTTNCLFVFNRKI